MIRPLKCFSIVTLVAAWMCAFPSTYRVAAAPQDHQDHKTWSDYAGGPDSSKFMDLTEIKKSNVGRLQVAWTYPDYGGGAFNPIVVGNVLYGLGSNSSLVALNASTGKPIWIHANLRGIASQGVNYWESKDHKDARLILQINHYIEEIDARTGKSILTFGKNGLVDLREDLGRDPNRVGRIKSDTPGRVFENLVILGSSTGEAFLSPPGDIRAYDVVTGALAWTFHTIPHPGEFGYETWPKDAWRYVGGVNDWGDMTLDDTRGIAYVILGSPTYDMYGADRVGMNLFGTSIVALDARTGKRLWHFQLVHHDLWDYDPCAAPQLITVRRNGRAVDAVAVAGKNGFLYVFDRVTGVPIFPIEERPVPASDVPGEQAWPTQPFPTVVPPFARQRMTADDVNPFFFSPEEIASYKERIRNARNEGLYTPPAWNRDTVQIPGARGGSNRGTTAADPEKGLVFVLTNDYMSLTKVEALPPAAASEAGAATDPGQRAYQQNCQACHGANLQGSGSYPSLVGVASRMNFGDFRQAVVGGKGQMPAFPNLVNGDTTVLLYAYLSNPGIDGRGASAGGRGAGAGGRGAAGAGAAGAAAGAAGGRGGAGGGRGGRGGGADLPVGGLVVASGGAPGGLELAPVSEGSLQAEFGGGNRFVGPPYPEGVAAPSVRLYSGYNLINGLVRPPWSEIVAYDLNKGTIKWRMPLGEDEEAVKLGANDPGMITGGERHGMVVTSTGLVFANAKDGKLRAFDEETGRILWTYKLPGNTTGIPAMYQADGRQYLVLAANGDVTFGMGRGGGGFGGGASAAPVAGRGLIAFALPK